MNEAASEHREGPGIARATPRVSLRACSEGEQENVALGARLSVLVGADPQWFGLRSANPSLRGDFELMVDTVAAPAALREGRLSVAPRDLPLPEKETPASYLSMAASLSGTRVSKDVTTRFGLVPFWSKPIRTAPPHVRNAIRAAAAYVSSAEVIVLEDPLTGLPTDVADEFTRVLTSAFEQHFVVWLAPSLPASSVLAATAGEAIWFEGAKVLLRGRPIDALGENGMCVFSVRGPTRVFIERLSADGVVPEVVVEDETRGTYTVPTRERWRIFSAATDVGAAVTDLRLPKA